VYSSSRWTLPTSASLTPKRSASATALWLEARISSTASQLSAPALSSTGSASISAAASSAVATRSRTWPSFAGICSSRVGSFVTILRFGRRA